MTARKPVVMVGGKPQQLPSGDSLLGMPAYLRAYQQAGTALKLNLGANLFITAYTQAGTGLAVQAVASA